MGVVTNCCTKQTIIQSASISVYSLSEEDIIKNNGNELPTILDKDHAIKFITSKDYYSFLIKNFPKHIIAKKICLKLKNNDIITLINNLFEWIQKEEFDKIDNNTKNNIIIIKENAKISLNYILKELKTIQLNETIEIFIIQALSSISLIIQCILFLVNNKNDNINEFKINIWENKNIIDEAKKYGFQASYFLLLIKKKYNNNSNNDINDKNKITNERKDEVNLFYKISIDYANNIINSQ